MYKYFFKVMVKILELIFLDNSFECKHYGTKYGGMIIANCDDLNNSTIISAGSGEDLTFDIELINEFDCKVILIDPTPRAIDYFSLIKKNFGNEKKSEYSNTGYENPEVYDLKKVNNENLKLVKFALHYKNEEDLKFYEPPEEEHVSYSITNWRGDYSKNSKFISVKSKTISSIITEEDIKDLSLLKLDIEGSEVPVLHNMLDKNIFPKQIAVEFSDLWRNEYITTFKFIYIFLRLKLSGYKLINMQRYPNLLFIRK